MVVGQLVGLGTTKSSKPSLSRSGGSDGGKVNTTPTGRQSVADGTTVLLGITEESFDWFPPLGSALINMTMLIKRYEVWIEWATTAHDLHRRLQQFKDVREKAEDVGSQLARFKQNIAATSVNGDPEETNRFVMYVRRPFTTFTLANGLCSALGKIEKESHELWANAVVAQFKDIGADSEEVIKLIERLREAVVHYQVSENWIEGRNLLT